MKIMGVDKRVLDDVICPCTPANRQLCNAYIPQLLQDCKAAGVVCVWSDGLKRDAISHPTRFRDCRRPLLFVFDSHCFYVDKHFGGLIYEHLRQCQGKAPTCIT